MVKGENERLLYDILNEQYPGQWVSEHKGIEGRKYRFDAANPSKKVAIEIDGGIHPFWITLPNGQKKKVMKSGHSTPEGIKRDMLKNNAAVVDGWKVLRYTPQMLKDTPGMIISAVRQLCGPSPKECKQTILSLDGMKQTILEQVQVKIQ